MAITYHPEMEQGSDDWHAARCGLLTASEMKFIITPTLKVASNDKERSHLYELLAQRITGYVEPSYVSDDMLRGKAEELDAKIAYNTHYEPLTNTGFVTNDRWGFTLGYSPDALVGDEGLIECKSRRQKYQVETIASRLMPEEFKLQVQTGLLVTGRKWCDFVSYCGGLPMIVLRIWPDETVQEAIIEAARQFEERLALKLAAYDETLASPTARLTPTERTITQEIFV
jgi:predicted phage-related endonuclease